MSADHTTVFEGVLHIMQVALRKLRNTKPTRPVKQIQGCGLREKAAPLNFPEKGDGPNSQKGLPDRRPFVYRTMLDAGVSSPEEVSKKIKTAFSEHPSWKQREKELRELRNKVTFAIFAQEDDLNKVTAMVDELFTLLGKASSV